MIDTLTPILGTIILCSLTLFITAVLIYGTIGIIVNGVRDIRNVIFKRGRKDET